MRQIYFALITLFSLLTLGACRPEPTVIYGMRVPEYVDCAFDAKDVQFEYILHSAVDASAVKVSATADAAWITSINTSTKGMVSFTVDVNDAAKSRTATITLKATSHQAETIEITQYGTPPTTTNHTLMFFFNGITLDRYFKGNIADTQKSIENGAIGDSNRVIYFRQKSKTSAYINELCYDPTTGRCVERKVVENIPISSSQMTAADLAEYIGMMASAAPANRYGIVMAGHGQGWITREVLNGNGGVSAFSATSNIWAPAIGAEVTRAYGESNVQLDIIEIAEGISSSNTEFDYILFDCCFMSNIEAIYDLRNSANYIIASPCEIMGKGFPYERTLPYLFKNNGNETDYAGAAESYYKYYRDEYYGSARCGSIAVTKCSEVDNLRDAAKRLMETGTNKYLRDDMQTYEGQTHHLFFDISEWCDVAGQDDTAKAEFHAQLEKTVIAKYSLDSFYSAYGTYGTYPINLDIYSGVTTSAPSSVHLRKWKESNWYKDVWPTEANEVDEEEY